MAGPSPNLRAIFPRDPQKAREVLDATLHWFGLFNLARGKDSRVWLIDPRGPERWSESPGVITLGELIRWLEEGLYVPFMAPLRKDARCGDFDHADGMERMARAIKELEAEACHLIPIESGRPGHAQLHVISTGMPMDEIEAILGRHGADVRGDNGKMMRPPQTRNRHGVMSRVIGDPIAHQQAIAGGSVPTLEKKAGRDDQSRSGDVQGNAFNLARHRVGFELAFSEATKPTAPGSGHLLERRPAIRRAAFRRSMIKALGFIERFVSPWRQKPSLAPNQEIQDWAAWANIIAREELPAREAHTCEMVIQAILKLATRCNKTTLALSCRDVANTANITTKTASKRLRDLCRIGAISRERKHRLSYAATYAINTQNPTPLPHSAAGTSLGVCPSDCGPNVGFCTESDAAEYFTNQPARFRVYRAILGGDRSAKAIAARLKMEVSAVTNHLAKLKKEGLIQREGHTVTALPVDFAELAERRGVKGKIQQRREDARREREAFKDHLNRVGVPVGVAIPKDDPRYSLKMLAVQMISSSPIAPTLPHVADPELEVEVGGKSDHADLRTAITLV